MTTEKCPCGSGKAFLKCCEYYFSILGLRNPSVVPESLLLSWQEKYSPPVAKTFMKKVGAYSFRISHYLDDIVDIYFPLPFKPKKITSENEQEAIFHIKHNILLSLFAAFSCISQGLFLQSGTFLRSACEDCLVLLDIFQNEKQLNKFLQGKYSTTKLLSRTKDFIPKTVLNWYGYFSANFAHLGPFHSAPYLPTLCFADNYVLAFGLRNIVWTIVTLHIVLERLHFDKVPNHLLWEQSSNSIDLIFNEGSKVFTWADKSLVVEYFP